MLSVDEPAVLRAAGLLRAFRNGDDATFGAILASDYQSDGQSAFRTFCAVFAYADRLLDAVEHETGTPTDDILNNLTAGLARIVDEVRNNTTDNTPGEQA